MLTQPVQLFTNTLVPEFEVGTTVYACTRELHVATVRPLLTRDTPDIYMGVPIDKPLWGFADIYGLARKIKSEFLCGKC